MGTEYSVYTNLQASRRSYRIGQDQNVRVYYYYYKDTMQEIAVNLIAQKAAAAIRVNGDVITDSAMAVSDANSIEDALARMILNNEEVQTNLVQDFFREARETMQTTSTFIGGYEMSIPEDEPDNVIVMHLKPEDKPTSVVEGEYKIVETPAEEETLYHPLHALEVDKKDKVEVTPDDQFVAVPIDDPEALPQSSDQIRLVFGMSLNESRTGRAKRKKKKPKKSSQLSLFDAL